MLPGVGLISQHRLLIMDIQIKMQSKISKTRPTPHIRWHLLEREANVHEFRDQVIAKMIDVDDMKGRIVNECWMYS